MQFGMYLFSTNLLFVLEYIRTYGKFFFNFQMKPLPPANLNDIELNVWIAWRRMTNREVARESAAKGQFINLAVKFLSSRKDCDYDTTKLWFDNEVFLILYVS